jgi:hypothetical protein
MNAITGLEGETDDEYDSDYDSDDDTVIEYGWAPIDSDDELDPEDTHPPPNEPAPEDTHPPPNRT